MFINYARLISHGLDSSCVLNTRFVIVTIITTIVCFVRFMSDVMHTMFTTHVIAVMIATFTNHVLNTRFVSLT